MLKISKTIKELANTKGITIAHVARSTGVPPQTLNNWLAGQEPRSLVQVKAVADFFEVSIEELCFNTKSKYLKKYDLCDEINAGIFEVVLRRIDK